MNVVNFISVHGQQQFEENAEINPIETKIENEKITTNTSLDSKLKA